MEIIFFYSFPAFVLKSWISKDGMSILYPPNTKDDESLVDWKQAQFLKNIVPGVDFDEYDVLEFCYGGRPCEYSLSFTPNSFSADLTT